MKRNVAIKTRNVGQTYLPNLTLEDIKDNLEEMKKCKESPLYFYNTYVRKDGMKELTQEEYDNHVRQVELYRNGRPLRGRKGKFYPMKPDELEK